MPTYKIYSQNLAPNAANIFSTSRTTHAYGPHPRQHLDLYTPSKPSSEKPRSIFIFLYGGGLVSGNKTVDMVPGGLFYANLGHFFADKLGFETIIMDYRLAAGGPMGGQGHGAKFPSGGEDLDVCLQWVRKTYGGKDGDGREIYIMGNSAGGLHMTTWLYCDQFKESRRKLLAGGNGMRVAGVVGLGAPYEFKSPLEKLGNVKVLREYYGDDAKATENMPISLLRKAVKEKEDVQWPKFLVLDSEYDPEEIQEGAKDFTAEMKESGMEVEYQTVKGHNHISPTLGLGTGIQKEEQWGYDVGKWAGVLSQ